MTYGRARHRLLPGTALAVVGLLILVPRVGAETHPKSYDGTRVTTPSSTDTGSFSVTVEWHREGRLAVRTWVTPPASAAGCPSPSEVELDTTIAQDTAAKITNSAADAAAPCNGTYTFRVNAKYNNLLGSDEDTRTGSIDVAAPPSNVKGVGADANDAGDEVAVTWTSDSNPAPDFLGYKVQRKVADGSYTTIAQVGSDETSYSDGSPPAPGSQVTYRVLGRRSGPHGSEVTSLGGGTKSIELPGATTTSAPGATDGGTTGGPTAGPTGGTAGATGGTAGTTGGAVSPTGGSVKTIPPHGPENIGKTGIGTKAPRLGSGGPDIPALSTSEGDANDAVQTELNYGTSDGLAGEDGSNSEDGLSSAFYEQGSGRGMAIPVATGFVLAAWAFHLRFLARAARPARVTAPRHRRF